MIGKNFNYNGFDMTDRAAISQGFALQNVDIITVQRQEITDNANDHGSESSRTLESGRLFSFTGLVNGITKELRGESWELINNNINIEPYMDTPYMHDLFFQTDKGEDRQVKALVKTKPQGSNGIGDPRINFSFELYAPDNAVYDVVEQIENGESSFFGGTNFPNSFGDSRGAFSGGAICNNAGNYKAGCEITITGTLVNPLIKNLSNGQQYKINGTTNNLVLNSKDGWTVEDGGVNISSKRDYGTAILLSPGDNIIGVFADSGNATFTVKRFSARNTI